MLKILTKKTFSLFDMPIVFTGADRLFHADYVSGAVILVVGATCSTLLEIHMEKKSWPKK